MSKKARKKQFIEQNTVEALKGIGSDVVKTVANDLVKETISDFWNQFLGGGQKGEFAKNEGELSEGQELSLADLKNKAEEDSSPDIEPAIDYRREILYGERRILARDSEVIETKIQEIIIELKHLIASSETLQVEFKEVSKQQVIVKPGKYHLSFFEWLLSTVRSARQRVEDSSAWLAVFSSKKAKRQYWAMFKKHGTTFGLSGERVVATQTG